MAILDSIHLSQLLELAKSKVRNSHFFINDFVFISDNVILYLGFSLPGVVILATFGHVLIILRHIPFCRVVYSDLIELHFSNVFKGIDISQIRSNIFE